MTATAIEELRALLARRPIEASDLAPALLELAARLEAVTRELDMRLASVESAFTHHRHTATHDAPPGCVRMPPLGRGPADLLRQEPPPEPWED